MIRDVRVSSIHQNFIVTKKKRRNDLNQKFNNTSRY